MLLWLASAASASLAAQENLALLEQAAFKEAAREVADSLVQIRTIGGLDQAGGVALGAGPTTGLVVGADGWIVSSAFNFAEKPSSILVYLSGGKTVAGKLVATDHSRMLVLLKIETDEPLPVPAFADEPARVGQWAIALGKSYSHAEPNVSSGIVSATGRMHGRAIQTDAKVSAAHYGGPLVDVRGRVLGVLVPMSPESDAVVAGAQWYDSGIGFAIPIDQILARLEPLQTGHDQWPGKLGIALKQGPAYSAPPEVASVEPNSPAAEAGIEKGDLIAEVEGTKVATHTDVFYQLKPRYAGETLTIVFRRGDETLSRDVTLVDQLRPYVAGFLGLLLERVADAAGAENANGQSVRYVFPSSPAEKAGIRVGDRITRIGESPISSHDEALEVMQGVAAGQEIAIGIDRDGEAMSFMLSAVALPEGVPENVPPPRRPPGEAPDAQVDLGPVTITLPDLTRECPAYVPRTYRPDVPHGLVIWLDTTTEKPAEAWVELCDRHDLVVLAPVAEGGNWQSEDLEYLERLVREATTRYSIDPHRVVVGGVANGATAAFALADQMREEVRGVVAVSGGPPQQLRLASDPVHRLAILSAFDEEGRQGSRLTQVTAALREAALPVTVAPAAEGEPPTEQLHKTIAEWIDVLDRL